MSHSGTSSCFSCFESEQSAYLPAVVFDKTEAFLTHSNVKFEVNVLAVAGGHTTTVGAL